MPLSKLFYPFFLLFLPFLAFAQTDFKLDKTTTLFPNWKDLEHQNISWYYLTVPENWGNPAGKKIKLAISVIKSTSGTPNSPVIFIQGGPGGGAIGTLDRWLEHPLRKYNDIILVDIRGTGYSEPVLCPRLGKAFLKILAKDQSPADDDKDKVDSAMLCRQDLLNRGIDPTAYNSSSVSKDLNALKTALAIKKWNVYGVSYGTLLAQEYANRYPDDIRTLTLDSPIPDISEYYDKNTSNYTKSLNAFFNTCKMDSLCNKTYPDIENIYYSEIEDLTKQPLTVEVDRSMLPTGKFTYNAEDFKVAVQQCLYEKRLIELLPLLIYQFHDRNKQVLSALVSAFSGALSLDYGTYYCHTCTEVIPYNNIDSFNGDAQKNGRLKGALDFYKSDFSVCAAWNKTPPKAAEPPKQAEIKVPVFILSGEFDPITPPGFADETKTRYVNSILLHAASYGHGPGFSDSGNQVICDFINGFNTQPLITRFANEKVAFKTAITLNKGISNFGRSLSRMDFLFLFPLILASFILLGHAVYINTGRRHSSYTRQATMAFTANAVLGVSSLVLIALAVYAVSKDNLYLLAFGLPDRYGYLFLLQKLFLATSLIVIILSIFSWRKFSRTNYFAITLFSMLVLNAYYFYWQFYI